MLPSKKTKYKKKRNKSTLIQFHSTRFHIGTCQMIKSSNIIIQYNEKCTSTYHTLGFDICVQKHDGLIIGGKSKPNVYVALH